MPRTRSLAEIRRIKDPTARAHAAFAYILEREAAIREARTIRDRAIRALIDERGVTQTARLTGMSISYVKQVRTDARTETGRS